MKSFVSQKKNLVERLSSWMDWIEDMIAGSEEKIDILEHQYEEEKEN
jgi:hypothetical protein